MNMSDYLEQALRAALFRDSPVTVRQNTTTYAVGDRVMLGTSDLHVYECVTAGETAGSPPSFDQDLGDETTDGTVVWVTLALGAPKRPLWVALFTSPPGDDGSGTEVSASGTGYARQPVPPAAANWDAPDATGGVTRNVDPIEFPAPTDDWGTVTHFGVYDRATGGHLLVHGAIDTPVTVLDGGPPVLFPAQQLVVTFA